MLTQTASIARACAAITDSGAISTNILDLGARVLVISGGKGLILDTVLPVHWSDVRSLVLPAVHRQYLIAGFAG